MSSAVTYTPFAGQIHHELLIAVCYLIIKGLLQTQSDGSTKLMDFFDEQRMCRLYEKFILKYYKKEALHGIVGKPRDDRYRIRVKK